MSKIYYHKNSQATGTFRLWGVAKTLAEIGATLAMQNETWPDKSCDGELITIGKKTRRTGDTVIPVKMYRLQGNKLKLAHRDIEGFGLYGW